MDYETLIQKIKEKGKYTDEELNKKIMEKQKELSNLVSKEGAAYIIAKEIGLDLFQKTNRRLEIKNVVPKVKNLNLTARIMKIFEPKEFEKDGQKGKVANIILGDNTGTIRLSLWNEQTEMIDKLKPGMVVETFGAYTKEDATGGAEIRLSKKGGLKILDGSDFPQVSFLAEKPIERRSIINLKEGEICEIRAAVVQVFETNFFYEICPQCGLKVVKEGKDYKCKNHGKVEPTYALVITGVLDDGTANIRSVFFRNAAEKLIGMKTEEALKKRETLLDEIDILGKEFVFVGRSRKNPIFGRLEFVVNDVKEIDIIAEADKILNSLLSNV